MADGTKFALARVTKSKHATSPSSVLDTVGQKVTNLQEGIRGEGKVNITTGILTYFQANITGAMK